MGGRRRRSGEEPQPRGKSAWAELDVDGRLSAYAQAQQLAAASGVHPRGEEALERFHGLQELARVNLAETGRSAKHRARRWRRVVVVLAAVVVVAVVLVWLSA